MKWSRCHDTLDVWVDSGLSWFVNYPNQVVDLYLEGSDQHRGWFQSSIYTSYVQRKTLPFKNLITHGFLVDENVMDVLDISFIGPKNVKIIR